MAHQLRNAAWVQKRIEELAEKIARSLDLEAVVLVGIRRRGPAIAKRLAERWRAARGVDVPLGAVDIHLHRDDVDLRSATGHGGTSLPRDLDGRVVVLVDDVLFTGRTVRAALNELMDFGRPAVVRLAVLVDRGGRELPIAADFVGERIAAAAGDEIQLHLTPLDDQDELVLLEGGRL